MSSDIVMKKGDRLPSITYQLIGPTGPMDLTAASGVQFKFEPVGGGTVKGGAAVVTNAALGMVRYDWAAGDTDTAGTWNAEWIATFAGKEMTFPADEEKQYLSLLIQDDVS